MTWLAWRQFRAQAAIAAAVTLAVTVVLVATRNHLTHLAEPRDLSRGYEYLRLLGTALIGVPAFIGAFWGAPLLARELEAGTHRLAWTQSVTRARWLSVKLGLIGVVTVAVTTVFSLVFTWWSLPLDRFTNRIGTANFGQRGIAPIAYAIFALVLGTLLGAVTRRTLPAMATTLVAFFVVRFAVQLLARPHFVEPISVSRPASLGFATEGLSATSGAWVLSTKTVDAAGHVVNAGAADRIASATCGLTRQSSPKAWTDCADRLGFRDVVRIQPANHFWALQAWEAAIFLLLAAVLAGCCFWWVRHRTA